MVLKEMEQKSLSKNMKKQTNYFILLPLIP
jgi:hypothetical protein